MNIEGRPYGYPDANFNWTVQERVYRDTGYPAEFGELFLFNQRYSGFFVPPVDSLYTFNIISDDLMRLHLSPNTSREHKELIAYANSWTRNSWNYHETQVSEPLYLKAGQAYYIEAVQGNGYGPWNIGFGAKVHSISWTSDRALADHETQLIDISSTVVKETQV